MIDVSSWQGRVKWTQVYRDGVRIAAVKLTEGSTIVDPFAAVNIRNARKAGVRVFVYHFAHPSNPVLGEVHHFLTTARRLGAIRMHDIVPHLDLEIADGLSYTEMLRWASLFFHAVDAAIGVENGCGLYSDAAFLDAIDARRLSRPVWGADFRSPPWDPPPYWWAWQHSCTGRVLGVAGNVDVSVVKHDPVTVAHAV